MSGEGDEWLEQMDNLVGFLEMDQMLRITKRLSKNLLMPQTKRGSSGRKVDGRIRILKRPQPARQSSSGRPRALSIRRMLRILRKRSKSSEIPINNLVSIQKRTNPGSRLTRLFSIQKALMTLSQSLQ